MTADYYATLDARVFKELHDASRKVALAIGFAGMATTGDAGRWRNSHLWRDAEVKWNVFSEYFTSGMIWIS